MASPGVGPSGRGYGLFTSVLGNRFIFDLLLTATRHVVVLLSAIAVLAFATIELVWLAVSACPIVLDGIVAIPTVEDVRAVIANQEGVVARPAVDEVLADSSEELVFSAKAAYLVIALPTTQLVSLVG